VLAVASDYLGVTKVGGSCLYQFLALGPLAIEIADAVGFAEFKSSGTSTIQNT
jgi:hypothetical protein